MALDLAQAPVGPPLRVFAVGPQKSHGCVARHQWRQLDDRTTGDAALAVDFLGNKLLPSNNKKRNKLYIYGFLLCIYIYVYI